MASVFTFVSAAALGMFALGPALAVEASAAPEREVVGAVRMGGDNNNGGSGNNGSGSGNSGSGSNNSNSDLPSGGAGSPGTNTGTGHN